MQTQLSKGAPRMGRAEGAGRLKKAETCFSLAIIFLPFLYQYTGIGSLLSLGEVLLLPFILYFIVTDLPRLRLWPSSAALYFVSLVTTLFASFGSYFVLSDAMTLCARLVFYAALILTAREHFRAESVVKIYPAFVAAMSAYVIAQYAYHLTSGGYLPIHLKYEWLFAPERRARVLSDYYRWDFRPSGLFIEPSYFSLFAMPAIMDMLIGSRKNYVLFALSTGAVLLTTATSGLVGICIMLVFALIAVFKEETAKKYVLAIALIGIVSVVATNGLFSETINRLQSGGSFNYRVTRGIMTYREMPLFHKIFGVGLNNLEAYMNHYDLSTPYDEADLNYCCSVLQSLNFSGIVGFTALIGFMWSLWRRSRTAADRCMCAILIFILCYEAILFTYRFAFYVIILEARIKDRQAQRGATGPFQNKMPAILSCSEAGTMSIVEYRNAPD